MRFVMLAVITVAVLLVTRRPDRNPRSVVDRVADYSP